MMFFLLLDFFQESNASNKKALESQTNKVSDINREVNALGKEIFEIKILVNENKDADDKNQASVNKKLQDIFSAKGNVNDQLNNLLYMLTNAEVINRKHCKNCECCPFHSLFKSHYE